MSTDQATVQKLISLRLAGLKKASEDRDVDSLMSWHSNDAKFIDPGMKYSVESVPFERKAKPHQYLASILPTYLP